MVMRAFVFVGGIIALLDNLSGDFNSENHKHTHTLKQYMYPKWVENHDDAMAHLTTVTEKKKRMNLEYVVKTIVRAVKCNYLA